MGWYLYGITLADVASQLTASSTEESSGPESGAPLLVVEQGGLAAIARLAPRDAYSAEAVQERAHDLSWLEDAVRTHNAVVERIHRAGVALPAKFGSVYPDRETLQADLAAAHDSLFAQLNWLRGCDEWGIHLYAEATLAQRVAEDDPTVRRTRAEMATGGPGRAYLLRRKLADTITDISAAALDTLAQTSYLRLADYAMAGERGPCGSQPAGGDGERELLYASFLVKRDATDDFLRAAQRLVHEREGLRCEYSGPWPPYSFASASRKEGTEADE